MARWRRRVGRRLRASPRESLALAAVVFLAAVAVYVLAAWLFPHHSVNHDEGVYLQQAAILLEGTLHLDPPVTGAVRPWFFVEDGGRLYPKYAPVAAALFAPGLAVGAPRVTLALVAAASVALVGLLAREAFDRRTAPVAAGLFASAPLFLLSSSVFLSYAPTTLFNLLFALAYVRAVRRESRRYAVLAGAAVGLAFFSRPFSAVLFALPFVGHALVTLAAAWRADASGARDRNPALGVTTRLGTVAALGSAFVGLALAYNWVLTGDPLVFPYEAFAPRDGIGFGHREILDYERVYTPALALRANGLVLWAFLTRWGPLGAPGSVLAGVGLVTAVFVPLWRRGTRGVAALAVDADRDPLPDVGCRCLLVGVAVTVSAGNVFFWGNLNVLADPGDPTDGLLAHLGPFYHFDLLVPAALFGAAGALALADRAPPAADRVATVAPVGTTGDGSRLRRVLLAVGLVAVLVLAGGAHATALGAPVERNAAYRDDVAGVYEPFESAEFEHALVFVPTPYGEWLNHPFQRLRNDPSFDGDAVYVLDRDAAGDAASLAAFGDRRPYRFTYRGRWPPDRDGVTAVVEPLTVRETDRLRIETRMGAIRGAESATVRLDAGGESVLYGTDVSGDTTTVEWVVEPDGARVEGDGLRRYSDAGGVTVDGPTEVTLAVTLTGAGSGSVTYRQRLTVVGGNGTVRAVWPPVERVCELTTDCGREGTYLDGGEYPDGVSLSSSRVYSWVADPRRSSRPTRRIDVPIATPPARGSSFVSPLRSP